MDPHGAMNVWVMWAVQHIASQVVRNFGHEAGWRRLFSFYGHAAGRSGLLVQLNDWMTGYDWI